MTRHPPVANGLDTALFGNEGGSLPERGETYLVLICCPHILDNLLRLGLGHATALGNDLGQDIVDFAGHVGSVAADVEEGLLGEQLANLGGSLLKAVLYIDLLGGLARKGSDQLELVAKGLLVLLLLTEIGKLTCSEQSQYKGILGYHILRIRLRT